MIYKYSVYIDKGCVTYERETNLDLMSPMDSSRLIPLDEWHTLGVF